MHSSHLLSIRLGTVFHPSIGDVGVGADENSGDVGVGPYDKSAPTYVCVREDDNFASQLESTHNSPHHSEAIEAENSTGSISAMVKTDIVGDVGVGEDANLALDVHPPHCSEAVQFFSAGDKLTIPLDSIVVNDFISEVLPVKA